MLVYCNTKAPLPTLISHGPGLWARSSSRMFRSLSFSRISTHLQTPANTIEEQPETGNRRKGETDVRAMFTRMALVFPRFVACQICHLMPSAIEAQSSLCIGGRLRVLTGLDVSQCRDYIKQRPSPDREKLLNMPTLMSC